MEGGHGYTESLSLTPQNIGGNVRRLRKCVHDVWPKITTTVLGPAEKKETVTKEHINREWITVLECISAEGKFTRPVAISKANVARLSGSMRTLLIGYTPVQTLVGPITALGLAGYEMFLYWIRLLRLLP